MYTLTRHNGPGGSPAGTTRTRWGACHKARKLISTGQATSVVVTSGESLIAYVWAGTWPVAWLGWQKPKG